MLNAALPHNNNGTAMSLEGEKKKYSADLMFTVMGYTTQDSIQKRMKASDCLERKNTLEKLKLYALENGQSLCIYAI